MKAAQPSVRLTEVPRVGHAPMLTEPAAAEAIADFLAQVP
jgi:pimeloyl-ACP methyl ester carboxylesterase